MMRGALVALLMLLPSAAAGDGALTGHGGPIMGVAVAPDGTIATASFDYSVGIWSAGTPHWREGHRAAVNAVAFLPDGSVVSGSDDFRVLHWANGSDPRELIAHQGKVMGLAVHRDGRLIASASWDGTIALVDPAGDVRMLEGHDQGVNAVVFSPDGGLLYSASADGTVRIWDIATGTVRQHLLDNGFGINAMVLAPRGDWLAYGTVDGVVRVVDTQTGAEIADFTLDRRPILTLAHDPVLGQLAVGDGDGFIMVIATADWTIARDFRATQHGPIWALAFSPDGARIYAGGLDTTLHSWPVATLSEQTPIEDGGNSYLRPPDEMSNGERQFARKCSICHSLTPGSARRAGPTLFGLFGRQAGTVGDYAYSDALDGSDIVWTPDTINALFDLGPDHYVPGTKMPMQRIAGAQDRTDLITYLKRATRP